jgi:uncharacterized membrane protein
MTAIYGLSLGDVLAGVWFLAAWLLYGSLAERGSFDRRSLSAEMNAYRHVWMQRMSERDLRMIDTGIMQGLQAGTAFFASTALLALGAVFTLLNATERMVQVFSDLPFGVPPNRAVLELKILGLLVIYAYAFFKFGWAYRLFNYCSILIGAVPPRDQKGTPEMAQAVERAATFNTLAGRHFNRGLRAFFMSVGYFGWFINAWTFAIGTTLVLAVLIRRQFFSRSRAVLMETRQ